MFSCLDELPKLRVLLKRFVLLHFQPGTEEEILQGMPVENTVDEQAEFMALKIDAIVADSEAVQGAAGPFQLAESVQLSLHDLLRQAAKFTEDLQLQFLGHACQFRRASGIKDDLERAHSCWVES